MAFIHKWAVSDLFEGLADVWQWLGLLNQSLVVVDQCQSHTEQDFRALVEQAIPNTQNSLQKSKQVNSTSEHVHTRMKFKLQSEQVLNKW